MLSGVRWHMADLPCEVRSTDRRTLERAAVVLRGAFDLEPPGAAPDAIRWHIAPPAREPDGPGAPDSRSGDAEAAGMSWRVRREGKDDTWRATDLDGALRIVEFGSIMAALESDGSLVTLHGALLDRAGTGLLILGPCESGKSTLATALWREGWALLGDDVSVAEPDGRARPLPRRVSLRHGSRALLGEPLWRRVLAAPSCSATEDGYLFHPSELDAVQPPAFTRLGGIVFLARRGVQIGPAEVGPINAAQALLALVPYSNVVRRAGLAAALTRLQPLAQAAPAFDLGRGPLPRMIQAIERQVLSR